MGPTESRTPSIHFERSRSDAARVMSNTARTPLAPWKYASLKSCRKVLFPMMSRIIMSTWTGRPCIDPRATDFFETTAPSVRMYDSSKAPDTKRWMRLVFPTPSSPTRHILNLNVFASGSTVGFRNTIRRRRSNPRRRRSEEHTSELQSQSNFVCRLLLEKKNTLQKSHAYATAVSHYSVLMRNWRPG